LQSVDRPSVLVLSRQNLPMLRSAHTAENRSARGAYLLREPAGKRDVTLIATGSEVEIAVAAAKLADKASLRRWSRCRVRTVRRTGRRLPRR
jgi:transketolase